MRRIVVPELGHCADALTIISLGKRHVGGDGRAPMSGMDPARYDMPRRDGRPRRTSQAASLLYGEARCRLVYGLDNLLRRCVKGQKLERHGCLADAQRVRGTHHSTAILGKAGAEDRNV